MKPIDFPQSTKVLQRPSTMAESECQSLPVWNDGVQCISCWKPSIKDRLRILFGGKVWLGVMSGKTQPPVFLSGECVFIKASIKDRLRAFVCKVKENIKCVCDSLKMGFKQADKRKHFFAGLIISFCVGVFYPLVGLGLGFTAGAIKEYWDSKGHGQVEFMDFIFTFLGSCSAFPVTMVLNIIL